MKTDKTDHKSQPATHYIFRREDALRCNLTEFLSLYDTLEFTPLQLKAFIGVDFLGEAAGIPQAALSRRKDDVAAQITRFLWFPAQSFSLQTSAIMRALHFLAPHSRS